MLVSDDFLSHAPGMEDHRGDSVYCELNRTELVEILRISVLPPPHQARQPATKGLLLLKDVSCASYKTVVLSVLTILNFNTIYAGHRQARSTVAKDG